MAWAEITYQWPDGSAVNLEVGSEGATYPQELSELVARVLEMYQTCCVEAGE